MSPSVQIDPSSPSLAADRGHPLARWPLIVFGALLTWLYAPILVHLAAQWWHDPNFSHGPFVPLFSLYVLWQDRARLRALPRRPSWSGLIVVLLGGAVLVAGVMGAELFLSRISLLIVLAGLVVLLYGWNHLHAALFPWAFLLLMIPIPKIVFNQITLPLQKFASIAAAHLLPVLGVPVFREGNIINLPAMPLEVAEACSGIRSLMSLTTLAIIYGYFMERRIWIRVALALASVPIAVAANAFRIVGTGLLVQYWDPDKAEGFFHLFSGWLIFVVSLGLLLLVHRAFVWIDQRVSGPRGNTAEPQQPANKHKADDTGAVPFRYVPFAMAVIVLLVVGVYLQSRRRAEIIPQPTPLASFPHDLGDWKSVDVPIEQSIRDVLGPGDFLLRQYRSAADSDGPPVDLFIAYFASQRAGDTMHSPQNCLPGSGWTISQNHRIKIPIADSAPLLVNQDLITKGNDRQLVLYWYFAHDRTVASEYSAKWYLVMDSMRMNRSDGSLIRLNTIMLPGESADTAMQRILPLLTRIVPQLGQFIPK